MKSPCYDCRLLEEDKNGDECRLCEARAEYAEGIETGYRLKVVRLKKKKEGAMAKRGTCGNCERGELLLPAFGLCWACYEARKDAEKDGGSVVEVSMALQAVKERIEDGKGMKGKLKKGGKQAEGCRLKAKVDGLSAHASCLMPNSEPETYKMPEPFGMIFLEFKSDKDQKLFNWLVDYSTSQRRPIDQQVLKILDVYVALAEQEAAQSKAELIAI